MKTTPTYWPVFFSAGIHDKRFLLHENKYKAIIISSLQYHVNNHKLKLYAFVIMSNHIHIIWQALPGNSLEKIRHNFMKYTAQQIKFELIKNDPDVLKIFKVNKKDRDFQFWKSNSLSIELFTDKVFMQKLEYIHNNPVKAWMCKYAEDYEYSSANFHNGGIDHFGILTSLVL